MKLLTANQRHTITTLLNCKQLGVLTWEETKVLIKTILFGDYIPSRDKEIIKNREEDIERMKGIKDRECLRNNLLIKYNEVCYWKDKYIEKFETKR